MIVLIKDGFYTGYANEKPIKEVVAKPLLMFWNYPIKIEGDITLNDLINILRSYEEFDDIQYLVGRISAYIPEFDEEPPKQEDNIAYIEVYKDVALFHSKAHGNSLDTSCWAQGIAKEEICDEITGEKYLPKYSLFLIHWAALKDVPLKIAEEAQVSFLTDRDETRYYKYSLTLGEFLSGLFNELCWFASPSEREGQYQEINRRLEEVKEGKAELIPAEEVFKRLEEKYKEE